MDDNIEINEKIIEKIDTLSSQMSELITLGKKANAGYEYINAGELSEMLGESVKTIYQRVHKKQLPYYKPGGKLLLFKINEVIEWIENGRYSSLKEIKENI